MPFRSKNLQPLQDRVTELRCVLLRLARSHSLVRNQGFMFTGTVRALSDLAVRKSQTIREKTSGLPVEPHRSNSGAKLTCQFRPESYRQCCTALRGTVVSSSWL